MKFKILRYFSLTTLGIVIVAAVLLVVLYRQVAIRGIVHLGEQQNVKLAQTILNLLEDSIVEYLDIAAAGRLMLDHPKTGTLKSEIAKLTEGTLAARIKIHDPRGIIVFSTVPAQIGEDEKDNADYEAAVRGEVSSKLIFWDRFRLFDNRSNDDNLIQTYIPIRRPKDGAIIGVFEIYTDVSALAGQVEQTEETMILGAIGIMGLLYIALLLIARHADRVIDSQRSTINERTRALEAVSAQLLMTQENERKRLAGGLHEGLAQSLAAIKLKLDDGLHFLAQSIKGTELKRFQGALDALEKTIDEVRSLATTLRPSSLDDLGLINTLQWYFRQVQKDNPGISITEELEIEETDVPPHLKIALYRIVEEVLGHLVRQHQTSTINIQLMPVRKELVLTLDDRGQVYQSSQQATQVDGVNLAAARERALLSGGTFATELTPWGAVRIRASWPLTDFARQSQAR